MPHQEVTRGGVRIPSVTQVIGALDKPGLYNWYGKYGTEECNKIKRESAEFGTVVGFVAILFTPPVLLWKQVS